MKIKTADLVGPPLDWAVAKALGIPLIYQGRKWPTDGAATVQYAPWAIRDVIGGAGPYVGSLCHQTFDPSTAGDTVIEIMEKEGINARALRRDGHPMNGLWLAAYDHGNTGSMVQWVKREDWPRHYLSGPTLRIAVCRCFVASKLGDEVDVPEELMP